MCVKYVALSPTYPKKAYPQMILSAEFFAQFLRIDAIAPFSSRQKIRSDASVALNLRRV
jgi:hypothetical protein